MRHPITRLSVTILVLSASGFACQPRVQVNARPTPPATVSAEAPAPLRIAHAEASPRAVPYEQEKYAALGSEGFAHALERNELGIALMSEANGVEGFMKSPSGDPHAVDVVWAGFVQNDALVVVACDTLYRAESMQAARDGKFVPLPHRVTAGAKLFASGGGKMVAYAEPSLPRLFVSLDNGRAFAERKLPERTSLIDLAIRRDGTVVIAHDAGKKKNSWGHEDQLAHIYVSRGTTWTKGPVSQSYDAKGSITHRGDTITVSVERAADEEQPHALALAKNGKWVPASSPASYLAFGSLSHRFSPEPIVMRPGYPLARANPPDFGAGGLLGGVVGERCTGAACLAHRSMVGARPQIHAFNDGVCPASDVVERKEKIRVVGMHGKPSRDEEFTRRECDPKKAALRTPALAVPTPAGPRVGRLPSSCASGKIVGTSTSPFLYCDGRHQGGAGLFVIDGTDVGPSVLENLSAREPDEDRFHGAESASDGTTVLETSNGVIVCSASGVHTRAGTSSPHVPRRCVPLEREDVLAARPLLGGRALVARRGRTDQDLVLSILGEETSLPNVRVAGNLLEFEVTPEGFVRLWIHPRETWWASVMHRKAAGAAVAFIVLADGSLRPDEMATRQFREEAARAPRHASTASED